MVQAAAFTPGTCAIARPHHDLTIFSVVFLPIDDIFTAFSTPSMPIVDNAHMVCSVLLSGFRRPKATHSSMKPTGLDCMLHQTFGGT